MYIGMSLFKFDECTIRIANTVKVSLVQYVVFMS